MTRRSYTIIAFFLYVTFCISILAAGRAKSQYPTNLRFTFVQLNAGEFRMGCSHGDRECKSDEKPQHFVRITEGFQIGKYPVTQAMWESVMENSPSHFEGADRPVGGVSWNDVQEFLRRLNAKDDGYIYRLPTEAEWEYAARAGDTRSRYGKPETVAWYQGNSGGQTHQVGQKKPNPWGLYDMLGNVSEWVVDWYDEKYYQSSLRRGSLRDDPHGPTGGSLRVLRGGSWNAKAADIRLSARTASDPSTHTDGIGFRCVRTRVDDSAHRPYLP
jgi:formylglycine-generating enzyme required for sulfatase activity